MGGLPVVSADVEPMLGDLRMMVISCWEYILKLTEIDDDDDEDDDDDDDDEDDDDDVVKRWILDKNQFFP